MPLTADDMRREAWNNVIHAQGTYAIFAARLARLKLRTDFRDWFGFIGIPAATAFIGVTEFQPGLAKYRSVALGILAFAALVQALLAGWSIIRRWDEQRAYCSRAMRDSYEQRVAWREIGTGDVPDIGIAYEVRKAQQRIIDSHDIEREITDWEKMFGLRAGLIEVQRKCERCKKIPSSRALPLFVWRRCVVCGGGINDRQEDGPRNQGVSRAG